MMHAKRLMEVAKIDTSGRRATTTDLPNVLSERIPEDNFRNALQILLASDLSKKSYSRRVRMILRC